MGFRILSPVFVPSPHGGRLCTVVCLPDDRPGPYPALGIRSPYSVCVDPETSCRPFEGQGVAVVLQDCGGTGRSEGSSEFLWTQEREDGQSFLDFLISQDWFDGRAVMTGESYSGFTQWQAARSGHPALVGIDPRNAPADGCRTVNIPSGAIAPAGGVCWCMIMGRRRLGLPDPTDWTPVLRHQPLLTADRAAGLPEQSFYRKMISNPLRDRFWEEMNVENDVSRIRTPAYLTGGWFDPLLPDTLNMFVRMRSSAGSEEAREWTRLLIEPVDHESTTRGGAYGRFCRAGVLGLRRRFLLNRLRTPESDPLPDQPPVRIFVMGANRYMEAEEWPPPAEEAPFFLRSGGRLTRQHPEPGESGAEEIFCDQSDPVPSCGGCDIGLPGFTAGQAVQNEIEKRKDVLLYTTDPLEEPLTVIGNVRAILFGSSDAPDADFTVKLCDVRPDGTSLNVCGGIARASFREGDSRRAAPLQKWEIVRLDAFCRATAYRFEAGHRIRIQVSWSDYPRFLPNPFTGGPESLAEERRNAVEKVHHDAGHPSRLVLPVYGGEI